MMEAIAFLFGLLIGSFLNVCVFRLPRDLSVVHPRSFCLECEKTIAWYDNIPVLSYLLLRGRCRRCQAHISVRYPVVELVTGLAFGLCVAGYGVTLSALKYAVFSAILIALIATDFEERILPDEFTIGGTLAGFILSVFVPVEPGIGGFIVSLFLRNPLDPRWFSLSDSIFAAVAFSGLFWLASWIYEKVRHREGMGMGDVKMIAMVGAFLGLSGTEVTLLIGGVLGVVVGGGYILIARKRAAEYELPYGSFLGVGAFVAAVLIYLQPRS